MKTQALIFDLDGTLLDTIHDIGGCANTVLASFGYPAHSIERYKELVGDGISNLARKVLPPGNNGPEYVERFVGAYRKLYAETWRESSKPYDGIPETLRALAEKNIKLSVLSNKRDDFTKLCVSSFFPDITFAEVRGERAGVPIKPHPQAALLIAESCGVSPDTCVFVGDSEIDILTAKEAGMRSIGVAWGFRSRGVLEAAGANFIIDSPMSILSIIEC